MTARGLLDPGHAESMACLDPANALIRDVLRSIPLPHEIRLGGLTLGEPGWTLSPEHGQWQWTRGLSLVFTGGLYQTQGLDLDQRKTSTIRWSSAASHDGGANGSRTSTRP